MKAKPFFTCTLVCIVALVAALTTHLQSQSSPASPSSLVVSPLGAPNNLPNPYRDGASWGQLPDGRKWGSTAGIALGLDRMVTILAGESSIRDVIAFPKTASAADLMSGSPSPVRDDQLGDLGILLVRK